MANNANGWYGLVSTLRQSKMEFDWWWSTPPMACPIDGEPLINGPSTDAGSGVQLFCKWGNFRWPADAEQTPVRPEP